MMTMAELKRQHQAEYNAFPIGFAFSRDQFKSMMEAWGLTEHDTDKIVSCGMGGYLRKTDVEAYKEMLTRFRAEEKALRKARKAEKLLAELAELAN